MIRVRKVRSFSGSYRLRLGSHRSSPRRQHDLDRAVSRDGYQCRGHPSRQRTHARVERTEFISTGRDGLRVVKPVTTSVQENADAGRAIISWIPSRLSFSETWLR